MNKVTQLSSQVKSINLDIDGMTCAACAARIERILSKNENVLDASVSFPLKSAIVDISDENNNLEEIIKSVNKIGYKAKEASGEVEDKKIKLKLLLPITSLIMTLSLKYLFEAGFDTVAYIVGFIVVLFLGRNFHISAYKKIKNHQITLWLLVLSLLFGIQSWLYVEAVKYMSVGLASVILFTYPLLTYLIVSLGKRRPLDLITILMFLIATLGIAAISQSSEGFYTMIIGIILALLSALSYSLILILTPRVSNLKNWEIVKYTTFIPALTFLYLFINEIGFYYPSGEGVILSLVSGILFATGMMFYHISVRRYGPVRTANIGYTEPLLVLIFGFMAYSDAITIIQALGVILVAIASITIERRQLTQGNSSEVKSSS